MLAAKRRRVIASISVSASVMLVGILLAAPPVAGVTFASPERSAHRACVPWRIVPVPARDGAITGLSGLATDDVWAVGDLYPAKNHPVFVHWDGRRWQAVEHPTTNDDLYVGISAISSSDVWAVGSGLTNGLTLKPVVQHWDGTSWTIVPIDRLPPGASGLFSDVAGTSTDDVWAVGQYTLQDGSGGTLAEHWDGLAWHRMKADVGALDSVTAISPDDVWASGGGNTPATAHWDGTTWTLLRPSQPRFGALFDITAIPSHELWAVGEGDNGGPLQPLTEFSQPCR